ncbi:MULTISPECIES: TniQ family protein [Paenibacillus]|uniref:TniQ family protein n=1 Tax=Paenibacillus TaxID=44249 RepID=UPI001CF0C9AB|nr:MULTISPECIES: TniQ family protein [Paenibacillus]
MRLLSLPYPYLHETIKSYLSRILKENNYQNISMINYVLNLTKNIDDYTMNEQQEIFKQTLFLPIDQIRRMFYSEEIFNMVKRNEFLKQIAFLNEKIKICPECLDDKMYYRSIWRFVGYTTCHLHHYLMVSECECGRKIESVSVDLGICKCRRDFRDAKRMYIKQKEDNHNLYFHSILMNSKNDDTVLSSYLNPFSVDAVIELMFKLANLLDKRKIKKLSKYQGYAEDINLLHRHLEEVYEVLIDPSQNICAFFEKLDQDVFYEELLELYSDLNREPFMKVSRAMKSYIQRRKAQGNFHNAHFQEEIEDILLNAISHKKRN